MSRRSTGATNLHQIAAQMRQIVDQPGARYCYRKLARGLELVLQRHESRYRLALGRTDAPPSDLELEICGAAFSIPAGAEPQRLQKQRTGKTGVITYHVVELYWTEQERVS